MDEKRKRSIDAWCESIRDHAQPYGRFRYARQAAVWRGSWTICLVFVLCLSHFSAAEPIRAGFEGGAQGEQLASFQKYGMNTIFWAVRTAPELKLALDADGRVVTVQVPERLRKKYIQAGRRAAEHGIDVYLVAAFFSEYVTQLKQLGPYNHAYVQGPTRYHSPGEKPAPGPLEEKYWLGQLLAEARLAAELSRVCGNIKGFLVDVEMYGGDIMWRWNSSFDDQTFNAVMQQLKRRGVVDSKLAVEDVQRPQRYEWLRKKQLLKEYFAVEQELVERIARRFRDEIDKINPDFQLGILPFEANWFYEGWVKGLGTGRAPVLICSENEYSTGLPPRTLSVIERLKKQGVHFRYVPGLLIGSYSPRQLAQQAALCQKLIDGYWLFTTYSLWQPQPQRLRGAYLIKADRHQYWNLLNEANRGTCGLPYGRAEPTLWNMRMNSLSRASCPGLVLLTNNRHYPGPKQDLAVKVTYTPQPDVVCYESKGGAKLFDGGEADAYSTVAWHAKKGREVSFIVDLSTPVLIERLRLSAAHQLPNFPAVETGKVQILTSVDGEMYYPLRTELLLAGRGKQVPVMDYERLGIKARYLKVIMSAEQASEHAVWAVSELAVWGPAPRMDS